MSVDLMYSGFPLRIEGYAVLWGNWTFSEHGRWELFRPGAFRSCLQRGARGAVANWNHDDRFTLARAEDRILRLWEDQTGLAFSTTVPATPFGRGVVDFVAVGSTGASIYFTQVICHETEDGDEIAAATLHDVCVTDMPADPCTACWLSGDAQPEGTLTPNAEKLRATWLAGRAARHAALLEAPARKPAAAAARPQPAPAILPAMEWAGPPPGGFTLASWVDFGEREALHRWRWKQNCRERERRQRRRA